MKQQKLDVMFFDRHHLDVARNLIGTYLHWDGDHGSSVLTRRRFLLPREEQFEPSQIMTDVRVGLSVGLDRQWRFLLNGNPYVSVPHGNARAKVRIRLRQT